MSRFRYILLYMAMGLLTLTACTSDPLVEVSEGGGFLLSIPGISPAVSETRSTPSEIYDLTDDDVKAALLQRFRVKIVRQSNGATQYNGPFTTEKIPAAAGDYGIIVSCGDNPVIARDAPYFEGTAVGTVPENATEPTQVTVNAKVANALVSATFGKSENTWTENGVTETEEDRFNKLYSDYALYVYNGIYGMAITKNDSHSSIYVPAGTHITLRFWGKLKQEDDREVSCELTSDQIPSTLSAADHLRVTLTLPDPSSDLVVSIAKVEVEQVTLEETIPLSWLPVSAVAHSHQYDAQGNLVGTNLMFTNSYPGMKWKAVVKNAAGTTVRAVQGIDALFSEYSTAGSWPYLPSGTYTAMYYLIAEDGTENFTSSREFQVGKPRISVSVGGYSSYTKYLQGDIEAANRCERLTVYDPSVSLSIDESLLQNSHYSYTFTYTYEGGVVDVPKGQKRYIVEKIENNAVRANPYVLKANAVFDGVTAEAQTGFLITGLPYSFNATSHSEWSNDGKVEWKDDYVQLGGGSVGDQTITTNSSIYVPQGTKYLADYNVNIHHSWVGTTFSITVSGQEILSVREGPIFIHEDVLHSGTTDVFTANGNLTSITCRNSYGADYNYSQIFALRFKYGQ